MNYAGDREGHKSILHSRHEQIRNILEGNPDGILIIDVDGIVRYANQGAENLLQRDRDQLAGEVLGLPLVKEKSTEVEILLENSKVLSVDMHVLDTSWEEKDAFFVTLKDSSRRKKAEEEIIFQASLLHQVRNAVMAIDLDFTIMYWNEYATELFGYEQEKAMGASFPVLMNPPNSHVLFEVMGQVLSSGFWDGELLVSSQDDTVFPVQLTGTIIKDAEEKSMGIAFVARDVTEQKETEKRLQYYSWHDSLTGLFNRRFFEEKMADFDKKKGMNIGVIVCDVDGLKIINDTRGHGAGDQLLIDTADILKRSFRAEDVVARIGGDEFSVLLPNSSKDGLEEACLRITRNMNGYNALNSQQTMHMSMGSAWGVVGDKTVADIYKEADNQMYEQKLTSGRHNLMEILHSSLEHRRVSRPGEERQREELSLQMARELHVSPQRFPAIQLMARYHNIGNIAIADTVLHKEEPLTKREYEEVQKHPTIGEQIARASSELAFISHWIRMHHEWWNGQGYPHGKSGEEIPFLCRLFSIVDAFVAMINPRPYRQPLSQEEALHVLRSRSGTQFDPHLISVFIKHMEANG